MDKTREEILESLRSAELEEGRSGLVAAFLASNPEHAEDEVEAEE